VAKRIQQSEKPRLIEEELNRLFSAEWLRETAKETGFVKRDRKIDPRLSALANSKGNITQANVKARCKATDDPDELALLESYKTTLAAHKEAKKSIKELLNAATLTIQKQLHDEPNNEDLGDYRLLQTYIELIEQISEQKKSLKDAEEALDAKAYAHYPKLSEDEIKTLVVDDKWLSALDADIHSEMDRISQSLTQRVKELAERYETPMPQMTDRVAGLEEKVNRHLERMGFKL